MPSPIRTSHVNSPFGRAQRRAHMKKATNSTVKLTNLNGNVLRRIASFLPASRALPPVLIQEKYHNAYTGRDFRNGTKHHFLVPNNRRRGRARGTQMVRQVLGKEATVPTWLVNAHLDGVANALARNSRRRKYNVHVELDNIPEGSPIYLPSYLSDDPDGIDEPISTRWSKGHKVHIRFPGGTAKDFMRVNKATRSALGRPADTRTRKTRARPPRPVSPQRSRASRQPHSPK